MEHLFIGSVFKFMHVLSLLSTELSTCKPSGYILAQTFQESVVRCSSSWCRIASSVIFRTIETYRSLVLCTLVVSTHCLETQGTMLLIVIPPWWSKLSGVYIRIYTRWWCFMLLNVSSINTTPVGFHAALNKGFIQSKGHFFASMQRPRIHWWCFFFFQFSRGLSSLELG